MRKERTEGSILNLFMLLCSFRRATQVVESDNVCFDFFASEDVAIQRKRYCDFKGTVCRHYSHEWLVV
jgi:hypothetical protein